MGPQWYKSQEPSVLIILSIPMGLLQRPWSSSSCLPYTEGPRNRSLSIHRLGGHWTKQEGLCLKPGACCPRPLTVPKPPLFSVSSPLTPIFSPPGMLFLNFMSNEIVAVIQSPAERTGRLKAFPAPCPDIPLLLVQTYGPLHVWFPECGIREPGGQEGGFT